MNPRTTELRRLFLPVLLCGVVGVAGCAAPDANRAHQTTASPPPPMWQAYLHSLDSGGFDVPAVTEFRRGLEHEDPQVQRQAVELLRHLRDPHGLSLLDGYAVHGDAAVKWDSGVLAEVAFTLGVADGSTAGLGLAPLATHADAEVRRRAVEALGRSQVHPVSTLRTALADPEPTVRAAAAIALWARDDKESVPALVAAFAAEQELGDPHALWNIVYAIARLGDARGRSVLDAAAALPAPWARTFATRGYRELQARDCVPTMRRVLADPASFWTARVEAVRVLITLRSAAEVVDPDTTEVLLEHFARESHPLVLELLCDALAEKGGDVEQAVLLSQLRGSSVASVRRAAARGYGKVAGARAIAELRPLLQADDIWLRVAAIQGLAHGDADSLALVRAQLGATESRQREAALTALAAAPVAVAEAPNAATPSSDAETAQLIRSTALSDPSRAVRGVAIAHLAEEKAAGWQDLLVQAYQAATAPDMWECRAQILHALESDVSRVRPLLERAVSDPSTVVRQLGRAGLRALGIDPRETQEAPADAAYRWAGRFPILDPAAWLGNPRLRFETNKGTFTTELYLEAAPLHVSNIVHLARTGFYEGLIFHRVVPGFVVQGGDPRHDGWGDAGYHIPDEINQIPFLRGTMGMPKTSDPGSGGCQIFINHLPTPHLDGRYTVFGRVVLGMEVVDALEVGDRILSVRVQENLQRSKESPE
ncbi:MAG: peptidylprolyl isomerase [Planctomycetota bacterium]